MAQLGDERAANECSGTGSCSGLAMVAQYQKAGFSRAATSVSVRHLLPARSAAVPVRRFGVQSARLPDARAFFPTVPMPNDAVNTALKAQILAEALPYIQRFHDKTIIIKYGGNAMTEPTLKAGFARDVVMLKLVGMNPVIVHGGGPQIGDLLKKMGIESEFRQGMRVTDEKRDERRRDGTGRVEPGDRRPHQPARRQGGRAHRAGRRVHPRPQDAAQVRNQAGEFVDIGLVGEIERIDPEIIQLLDSRDFIPVIAPIGVGTDGEAYNINADLVAGKLAETLKAEKLVLMTNTVGVLDKNGTLLTGLTASEIDALFADGTISGGMLPKIGSALDAVKNGVKSSHIIDGRVEHALLLEVLTNEGVGTMIRADNTPPRYGGS